MFFKSCVCRWIQTCIKHFCGYFSFCIKHNWSMWCACPYKLKTKFCMAHGQIISFAYYAKTKLVTKKYYTYLNSATKSLLETVIIISFEYKELCLIVRRTYPFFMFFWHFKLNFRTNLAIYRKMVSRSEISTKNTIRLIYFG